jgi:hypothetical protein
MATTPIRPPLEGAPLDPVLACEALLKHRRLRFRYDGFERIVEVHAVGATPRGEAIMLAWQVRGGANSRAWGWKKFILAEAGEGQLIEERSFAPRRGFRRNDEAMARIFCES